MGFLTIFIDFLEVHDLWVEFKLENLIASNLNEAVRNVSNLLSVRELLVLEH
jgi:hypothetical protein